eukprot:647005-Rhodomonas_salina.1
MCGAFASVVRELGSGDVEHHCARAGLVLSLKGCPTCARRGLFRPGHMDTDSVEASADADAVVVQAGPNFLLFLQTHRHALEYTSSVGGRGRNTHPHQAL